MRWPTSFWHFKQFKFFFSKKCRIYIAILKHLLYRQKYTVNIIEALKSLIFKRWTNTKVKFWFAQFTYLACGTLCLKLLCRPDLAPLMALVLFIPSKYIRVGSKSFSLSTSSIFSTIALAPLLPIIYSSPRNSSLTSFVWEAM